MLLLTLLALLLVGPAASVGPPVGATVELIWFDPQDTLPEGFAAARREIDSIFRGIGVDARWTRGGDGVAYVPAARAQAAVILVAEDRSHGPESIMGLVLRRPGSGRTAWVFVNSVRAALGHDLRRARPNAAEAPELQRAVARVAAHEVVHAIAPDEPHAGEGLMSPALGRRFLLGERAAIDGRFAAAFRRALLAPAPVAPPASLRTASAVGP